VVRVIEYRDQIIDDFRKQEMIEELAAAIAHIGAFVPKSSSNRREGVEAAA
jgi:hypothetical protein